MTQGKITKRQMKITGQWKPDTKNPENRKKKSLKSNQVEVEKGIKSLKFAFL